MERRRKKPDGKRYGLWHQGRHGDLGVLEPSNDTMVLGDAEPYAQTSNPLPDTMTFPDRRAPLWVVLSVLSVASLVVGLVVIQTVSKSGGTPPTSPPAAALMPDKPTARPPVARPQTARTVTVHEPGATTTVRVPVPGPTVTAAATPTPVPGPTVTVTKMTTPKPSPSKARPTVTVTVTVTETVTASPSPTATGVLPNLFKEKAK